MQIDKIPKIFISYSWSSDALVLELANRLVFHGDVYKRQILDGAKIGSDCIIGAGSLVTKNTIIPEGSLVMGSPAKIKRNLTWEEKIGILENSKEYVCVAEEMWKQGVL